MKANIEKKFAVEHSIEHVWAYLSNPEKIVSCVPGASLTEKVDEENYKGKVAIKFGPVSAKYDGAIKLEKRDQASKHMIITGDGMDSKGKGNAGMVLDCQLSENGSQSTEVSYEMEISVTGKLAQFGSRLIVDVSDKLADQFIDSFRSALDAETSTEATSTDGTSAETASEAKPGAVETTASPAPAKDNSVNALALMWAVIKDFFKRLFGGGK